MADSGDEGTVRELNDRDEGIVENQRADPNDPLRNSITPKQILPSPGIPAADPGTQGHPPHEDRQNQGLGVGSMTQEQLQIMGPDRLIDQAREPRHGKQEKVNAAKTIHTAKPNSKQNPLTTEAQSTEWRFVLACSHKPKQTALFFLNSIFSVSSAPPS